MAVGRNMECDGIGEGHAAIAVHPRERGWTDRQVDVRHAERSR